MLKVYYANITTLLVEEIWNLQFASVRPERQRKILDHKIPIDRCRSLGAGLLLRLALTAEGIDYEDAVFETGEHGKPELVSVTERQEPESAVTGNQKTESAVTGSQEDGNSVGGSTEHRIQFNLSHAGNFAVCAISDGPVGVDVERTDRDVERIAKRVFTEAETDYIAICSEGASEDAKRWKLTEFWTRKESYAKMTGKGLAEDFRKIETLSDGVFYTMRLDGQHILTVCLPQPEEEPKIYEVTIGNELRLESEGLL